MTLVTWLLWLVTAPVEPARVTWTAPSVCPDEVEFAAQIEALRGDARLGTDFEFEVRDRRKGELELRVEGHEARYFARECGALVDTALLLVSLTLVESGPGEEAIELPESSPRQPSAGERALEAEDVAPFLRADVRPEPRPLAWRPSRARVLTELGVGGPLTPQPAAELFIGAGPRGTNWSVDRGLLARPLFVGQTPTPEVGARLSTWGGLVRTCVGGRTKRLGIFGCGGVELAMITARPFGALQDTRVGRRPWVSLELGPELAIRLRGRLALVARVSASYLAVRPQFEVSGAGAPCCAHQLGITGRLGIEFGVGR